LPKGWKSAKLVKTSYDNKVANLGQNFLTLLNPQAMFTTTVTQITLLKKSDIEGFVTYMKEGFKADIINLPPRRSGNITDWNILYDGGAKFLVFTTCDFGQRNILHCLKEGNGFVKFEMKMKMKDIGAFDNFEFNEPTT
jgi:hypothetical protein